MRRMAGWRWPLALLCLLFCSGLTGAWAQERVVDVATRGVKQRFLLNEVKDARAVVVLFTGGDGGLRIGDDGSLGQGRGNFLVRSRQLFADQGYSVAVIDAPSDRQQRPFLAGFRQTAEHTDDVRQVMQWLRQNLKQPVWLIGTSRGTQSVAAIAVRLAGTPDSPDGIVLTSSILQGNDASRPLPAMALETLSVPVLVVHHEQDACRYCLYSDLPALMDKLKPLPVKALQTWRGGQDRGDPCEAFAYHGYNGLEKDVISGITHWIRNPTP